MKKTTLLLLLLSLVTVCEAQNRYCMTYEDFVNGNWVSVDTFYVTKRTKTEKFMGGGNDYKIVSKEKDVNKAIKKAFVIAQGDSMYVNCRYLRYQKTKFRGGYAKAWKIGTRSVLFVNMLIGKEVLTEQTTVGIMFGLAGTMAVATKARKYRVCYVISEGADEKGKIQIRLLDDDLIKQMLDEQAPSLLKEFYAESDDKKRIAAEHVMPILMKSGLIKMGKNKS